VKGVQSADTARALVDAGVDGIVVSNHGGRQLDRSPVPLEQIGAIRAAVENRAEILVDGGFLSGSDIVAALCLGADAVLLGRAYLYGLLAGGERGVDRVLAVLAAETMRTMQLLGAATVADLNPDLVRLRGS
jgi:L-lactate dehydrogenase (cytochrome)